ncbi:MAG: CoA pyrophosphatase [Crocinitomicaceae bacterium]|jgi:8-oxo-dGTP pyrophosphatase MutT (NUDIX family)|nr:CoA pyrophosphatase [Crocinitomicaceae bacterium]
MTQEEIKYKLQHFVFGEKLWDEFAPYRNNKIPNHSNTKNSSVALHIMLSKGQIQLILIERSKYRGTHSQQIAFPGGKQDPNDNNQEYTARRESFEEIGFEMKSGKLIGELTEIYIPVSGFKVKPYVFFHYEFPEFKMNKREINSILTCKLSDIDTQTKKSFKDIRINESLVLKKIPGIQYENHFIWGATALILHEFNTAIKSS